MCGSPYIACPLLQAVEEFFVVILIVLIICEWLLLAFPLFNKPKRLDARNRVPWSKGLGGGISSSHLPTKGKRSSILGLDSAALATLASLTALASLTVLAFLAALASPAAFMSLVTFMFFTSVRPASTLAATTVGSGSSPMRLVDRRVWLGFVILLSCKPLRIRHRNIPCHIDIVQYHHNHSSGEKLVPFQEREMVVKVNFAQAIKLVEFFASVGDDEVVRDM